MSQTALELSSFEEAVTFFADAPADPVVYRLGELFCGPGGMGLGASMVQIGSRLFRHAWATDYDVATCKTFKRNLGGTVYHSRVEDLRFSDMAPIDGLAFGFPCNDFSHVGERRGTAGDFGGLYIWGARALKHFAPLFFVAENVGGLRSANDNGDFTTIIRSFERAGYGVTSQLYRLDEYGIPQTRNRIFIVGIRKDLGIPLFQHLEPTGETVTCKEAIESPPIPNDAANNEPTRHQKQVVERLGYIKPGENAFSADIPDRLRLNVRGATISQIYRRLDPAQPSYTVTGSGGGGTHVYHWDEPRALTNRERARLQTFPDTFVFEGGKESVRSQVGMAVPPKIAERIFRAVLAHLITNKIEPQT